LCLEQLWIPENQSNYLQRILVPVLYRRYNIRTEQDIGTINVKDMK